MLVMKRREATARVFNQQPAMPLRPMTKCLRQLLQRHFGPDRVSPLRLSHVEQGNVTHLTREFACYRGSVSARHMDFASSFPLRLATNQL